MRPRTPPLGAGAEADLRRLWGQSIPVARIAAVLGRTRRFIQAEADRLGLPARKGRRDFHGHAPARSEQTDRRNALSSRVGGDIRRRQFHAMPDPILLRPAEGTLFGFPIREIEPATRALIDAALHRHTEASE